MSTMSLLETKDLLPGDVLLHMGAGELSRLIAWAGDSAYSHAALVVDRDQLIEAGASGVRRKSLADRSRMTDAFHYVDVFRPYHPAPNDAAERTALIEAADRYLDRPYPMTSLLLLGVVCAVRNKLTDDARLREVLRAALDLVVENDDSKVVCSELVYRGFDEARTAPSHRLRLELTTRAVPHQPIPNVDVRKLLEEYLEDCRHSQPHATVQVTLGVGATRNDDLKPLLDQARNRLGLGQPMTSSSAYVPNPKTVLPADLEFSPGLRCVGRLRMSKV